VSGGTGGVAGEGGALSAGGMTTEGGVGGGDACDATCSDNQECIDDKCECVLGTVPCGDACVSTSTEAHCGSCDNQCDGAELCTGVACKVCLTGCAVLNASVQKELDVAWFKLPINPVANLNNATITFRVYAQDAKSTGLNVYVVNADDKAFYGFFGLTDQTGWAEYQLKVEPQGTADFSQIKQIELGFMALLGGTPHNPSIAYLDSVTFDSGNAGPFEFAASGGPLVYQATSYNAGASNVTGTISWLGN
jgi:hypothetical protein